MATVNDDVSGDLLKQQGEDGLKIVTQLINNIHETGEWPKDLTEVRVIALQKPEAAKCSDHRTVSLATHIAEMVARMLKKMIENKVEDVLGEDKFGFRRGKVTRNAMSMLRIILERTSDIHEELCACFIDWQKAFGIVKCTKLMQNLKETRKKIDHQVVQGSVC